MNKYHAKKTEVDGIVFDSKRESERYKELKLLEKVGEIRYLKLQPKYDLVVNGQKICTYKADFQYEGKIIESNIIFTPIGWKPFVEDVKGVKTPVYRLKKKLMKALHGIDILET